MDVDFSHPLNWGILRYLRNPFDVIVGPKGPLPLADALRQIDCPVAPELYKPST